MVQADPITFHPMLAHAFPAIFLPNNSTFVSKLPSLKNNTMKQILSIAAFLLFSAANAQNTGIGNLTPTEKLHVDSGNIKIGSVIWSPGKSHLLKFGDGDFLHIGEVGDDSMEIKARNLTILTPYGPQSNIDLNGSLHVNGTFHLVNGLEANNKVLQSNSTGDASWAYPPSYNSGFNVSKSTDQSIFSGSSWAINFDNESYDDASAFSGSSFIAPATGVYHFDVKLLGNLSSVLSRYTLIVALYVGGAEVSRTQHLIEAGITAFESIELSVDRKVNSGQAVSVYAFQNSGVTQGISSSFTSFSGHRIY
jgi:hypothetical protein